MVMPIVAEELCTIIVHIVPTAIAPSKLPMGRRPEAVGVQSKSEKKPMNSSFPARIFSSCDIIFIPRKSSPNPSRVRQAPRTSARRAIISPATAAAIAGSARSPNFSEMICPVMVVPTFAPKMTPIA